MQHSTATAVSVHVRAAHMMELGVEQNYSNQYNLTVVFNSVSLSTAVALPLNKDNRPANNDRRAHVSTLLRTIQMTLTVNSQDN